MFNYVNNIHNTNDYLNTNYITATVNWQNKNQEAYATEVHQETTGLTNKYYLTTKKIDFVYIPNLNISNKSRKIIEKQMRQYSKAWIALSMK